MVLSGKRERRGSKGSLGPVLDDNVCAACLPLLKSFQVREVMAAATTAVVDSLAKVA